MKSTLRIGFVVIALACTAPVMARDSVAASVGSPAVVSIGAASIAVVSIHAGGEMIVESMRAVGNGIEVVLKGAAGASRAVVTLTTDAAKAASLGVGQSVKVVAVGSGYVLTASGKALGFIPGEEDKGLVRSARSQ